MADEFSPRHGVTPTLRFACSCISAAPVSDDPWANVSKQKRCDDGTKELILNAIHRQPRTVSQLATELGLSAPAVHRHVTDLLSSELIREVDVPQTERQSPVARYYAPNFPVVLASDRQELLPVLEEIARAFAEDFRRRQEDLAAAYVRTNLPARGERFEQLLHCLYTAVIRIARERLEEQGVLPPWPEHSDGSRWLWWAEEPLDQEAPRLWEVR
jgi:DNA-binding transcriptional ArsR family regulator